MLHFRRIFFPFQHTKYQNLPLFPMSVVPDIVPSLAEPSPITVHSLDPIQHVLDDLTMKIDPPAQPISFCV